MFLDELTPVVKEIAGQPIAFLGGFFTGLFRLNLADDPVKTWLDKQVGATVSTQPSSTQNGKGKGPQTISIE